jgi:hypothetical protein
LPIGHPGQVAVEIIELPCVRAVKAREHMEQR